MNTNWRQNIPLIVGLAIPIVMVIAVFATIYIPRSLVQPQTNFVYAVGDYPVYEDYNQEPAIRHTYQLSDGQLQEVVKPVPTPDVGKYDPYYSEEAAPTFHLYDVKQQQAKELSWEEVQKVQLDKNETSPDGFHVEQGGRNGSIFDLFGSSGNYGDWFLVGHNASFKLNLNNLNTYQYDGYDRGFHFVGWVK